MIEPKLVPFDMTELYKVTLPNVPDGLCRFNRPGASYSVYYKTGGRILFLVEIDIHSAHIAASHYKQSNMAAAYNQTFLGDYQILVSFAEFIDAVIECGDSEIVDWVMFNLDLLSKTDWI